MKKMIFAAVCCAALMGFTACDEIVSKDIVVSMSSAVEYSKTTTSSDGSVTSGVTVFNVQNLFMEELAKIGTKDLSNAVVLRAQSDAKAVKQKVEQAAQSADQRVKNELGVPDKLDPGITMLKIYVTYTNVDDEKVTLTYTYKE